MFLDTKFTTRILPSIFIHPFALAKMETYIKVAKGEISGIGKVVRHLNDFDVPVARLISIRIDRSVDHVGIAARQLDVREASRAREFTEALANVGDFSLEIVDEFRFDFDFFFFRLHRFHGNFLSLYDLIDDIGREPCVDRTEANSRHEFGPP